MNYAGPILLAWFSLVTGAASLKLSGDIEGHWFWVLSPAWGPIAFILFVVAVVDFVERRD